MLVTLLIMGILILGIVGLVLHNYGDFILGIGMILTFIGFIGTIIVSISIIDTQVNKEVNYQNTLYEKMVLEYRLDNMEDDIVGNEMIYNDIVEFNNELRSVKKWANNPWTNWLYNEKIAIIDYIKIDGVNWGWK